MKRGGAVIRIELNSVTASIAADLMVSAATGKKNSPRYLLIHEYFSGLPCPMSITRVAKRYSSRKARHVHLHLFDEMIHFLGCRLLLLRSKKFERERGLSRWRRAEAARRIHGDILIFPFPSQEHMIYLLDLAHHLCLTLTPTPKNLSSSTTPPSNHSSSVAIISNFFLGCTHFKRISSLLGIPRMPISLSLSCIPSPATSEHASWGFVFSSLAELEGSISST
ncbi:hypothetical protein ACLOJK_015773 [Asimina triloba]